MRNRMEAGGADCPSVSSGLAGPGEPEIGGFLGRKQNGLRHLRFRAVLIFFFRALGDTFGIFAGPTQEATLARYRATPRLGPGIRGIRPRERLALRSSIAAHPPIPKLAERAIKTSPPEHGGALTSRSLALPSPS